MSSRSASLIGVIGFAAILRILPHPWNFTPIAAMGLFAGAHFRNRGAAFAIPLAALFLSDLVLGFYRHMWLQYAGFALVVCVGFAVREHRTFGRLVGAAICSSVLFFVVTNFGVWLFETLYPKTWAGLTACYVAAIPFFQGTWLGDLAYTAAFFGAFRLAERSFPTLEKAPSF
jgi:hypothetical protein